MVGLLCDSAASEIEFGCEIAERIGRGDSAPAWLISGLNIILGTLGVLEIDIVLRR